MCSRLDETACVDDVVLDGDVLDGVDDGVLDGVQSFSVGSLPFLRSISVCRRPIVSLTQVCNVSLKQTGRFKKKIICQTTTKKKKSNKVPAEFKEEEPSFLFDTFGQLMANVGLFPTFPKAKWWQLEGK